MFRYLFLLACLLAPLASISAHAADYQNALSKASERKPVVLFCYGANYDKVSEEKYELFVKKRKRIFEFFLIFLYVYGSANLHARLLIYRSASVRSRNT